jgi:hypothetical protein
MRSFWPVGGSSSRKEITVQPLHANPLHLSLCSLKPLQLLHTHAPSPSPRTRGAPVSGKDVTTRSCGWCLPLRAPMLTRNACCRLGNVQRCCVKGQQRVDQQLEAHWIPHRLREHATEVQHTRGVRELLLALARCPPGRRAGRAAYPSFHFPFVSHGNVEQLMLAAGVGSTAPLSVATPVGSYDMHVVRAAQCGGYALRPPSFL